MSSELIAEIINELPPSLQSKGQEIAKRAMEVGGMLTIQGAFSGQAITNEAMLDAAAIQQRREFNKVIAESPLPLEPPENKPNLLYGQIQKRSDGGDRSGEAKEPEWFLVYGDKAYPVNRGTSTPAIPTSYIAFRELDDKQ